MIETFTFLGFSLATLSTVFNLSISQKKFFFWAFIVFLILFDGLRWKMGTDWTNYFNNFVNSNNSDQPGMELGFKLYTSAIRNFTDNYSVYLFITTSFIYIGIFYGVFKLTHYSLFSVSFLTGYIPWYSGSLRQMMATVFFVLSLKYLLKRKLIIFLCLMIIGASFHVSIATFFPFYFIYGINLITFLILFASCFIVSTLVGGYLTDLDKIIQLMNPGKSIVDKFGGEDLKNTNPFLGFSRKIVTELFYIYFYIQVKLSPTFNKKNKIDFFLFSTSFSILFYFLGAYYIENLSSRLDIYTGIICAAILIGLFDCELKSRNKRFLLLFVLLFLLLIFYSRLEYKDLFSPYSSIFYNTEFERNLY